MLSVKVCSAQARHLGLVRSLHGCEAFPPCCVAQGLAAAVMGVTASSLLPDDALALPAGKVQAADVGSYLPKAGIDDFVEFTATKDLTPVSLLTIRRCHYRELF